MKTPSGFAHLGSLRGPLIHSVLYRALLAAGLTAKFTFVFNDFDAADEFPPEFKDELVQYAGCPLKDIPSPQAGFENLAGLLVDDLKQVMISLGVEAEYLSSWEMYQAGKFDGVIREALDHAEEIQDIYQKVSGSQKRQQGWLPFQVVCEQCGKLGTTKVTAWDGELVTYRCEENLVTWAKGCGQTGKISPFGGTGKLPWKVDWPAHWKVVGVTIEGAGKDHASAGGSYDIATELCDKVFDYPRPYKLPYEFILIGGKKMSSSKGLGLRAHDIVKMLPPELARFLFTRTNYREQIEFDPMGSMAIPDLFDEYDECWQAYIDSADESLARAFELSQIKEVPKKEKIYLPRFRDVANYLQLPNVDLVSKFEEEKGKPLSEEEKQILNQREEYARIWLENYAPEEFKVGVTPELPEAAKNLTPEQKEFLTQVIGLVEKIDEPEKLQTEIYNLASGSGLGAKDGFAAIYLSLIGKTHGPKAAWLILDSGKEFVVERLKEASK